MANQAYNPNWRAPVNSKLRLGKTRSLEDSRGPSGLNTMREQIAFTMWKLELHTKPDERGSSSDRLAAGQRRGWEKKSETDTPQSRGHQPYRSRERDLANAFADPLKTGRGKRKTDPHLGRQNK